jgi:hypothetical protein
MKRFSDILETVYPPRGGDEQHFWDKHLLKWFDYPGKKPEVLNKKDRSRKADYQDKTDEKLYESDDVPGRLHQHKQTRLKQLYRDSLEEKIDIPTRRADRGAEIVRTVATDGTSKVYVKRAPKKEIKIGEEVEDLSELSKETLKSYRDKSIASQNDLKQEFKKTREASKQFAFKTGDDEKTQREKSARQIELSRKENEIYDKEGKRNHGQWRAEKRLAKEEIDLVEYAIKVGQFHLKDDSSKLVSREDADCLNALFGQLSGENQIKMKEQLMQDSDSFGKVLAFAKQV